MDNTTQSRLTESNTNMDDESSSIVKDESSSLNVDKRNSGWQKNDDVDLLDID